MSVLVKASDHCDQDARLHIIYSRQKAQLHHTTCIFSPRPSITQPNHPSLRDIDNDSAWPKRIEMMEAIQNARMLMARRCQCSEYNLSLDSFHGTQGPNTSPLALFAMRCHARANGTVVAVSVRACQDNASETDSKNEANSKFWRSVRNNSSKMLQSSLT